MKIKNCLLLIAVIGLCVCTSRAQDTYAEKLGFPRGVKVIILHVDDAGMSLDSNEGAIAALEKGVSNSVSVMMPCPWVPSFVHYLKKHPSVDAGLHLTLTSEWDEYRWGPLSGRPATPGLVDSEGALWPTVEDVVKNAKPVEVDAEIRAQLARARAMGFEPTHLDSHMGTLFGSPEFIQAYVKLGIENKIPVMMPGGHLTMLEEELNKTPGAADQLRKVGNMIWTAGLPVLDDLHNVSYNWKYPQDKKDDDAGLRKIATANYIKSIKALKPGLTMVIMHCTSPSPAFAAISGSGIQRKADMLAMTDPEFKKFIQSEGIVLTTWRELMEKRKALK
ncbi:MAG: polysaccharide deacetylase family protein [Chryseolinea sp.]